VLLKSALSLEVIKITQSLSLQDSGFMNPLLSEGVGGTLMVPAKALLSMVLEVLYF
jgi:hypothetical protein